MSPRKCCGYYVPFAGVFTDVTPTCSQNRRPISLNTLGNRQPPRPILSCRVTLLRADRLAPFTLVAPQDTVRLFGESIISQLNNPNSHSEETRCKRTFSL